MADETTSETLIVEGRTVVTAETVERPASERPAHDSIDGMISANEKSNHPRTASEQNIHDV
jgi:hypothetical protein